ncbi:hypothetical protein E2C01_055510 [Portunus trituberculatus]|uniref:Uncharacterized protein n=1 Tax=Portunus trituberculatus TaxID=210409 RepID=A0A5B7GX16_PORTR|nr:hypothetical protein [Portunus trituberculatus]
MRFLPASAWVTPYSVITCTAYICLLTPSALSVGLPVRPLNISCFNAHSYTLHYIPGSLSWASQHSTCPHSWGPQAFTLPSNLLS